MDEGTVGLGISYMRKCLLYWSNDRNNENHPTLAPNRV